MDTNKNGFEIKDDGSVPLVFIDGKKLNVVSLIYRWHTTTENPSDGKNICIVQGFLEGETLPRGIVFDISRKVEMEKQNGVISG